ncbi:CHAT domain-containing tetratricopeptide repeat protein, partial [Spirillospora sp. NPDC052269]
PTRGFVAFPARRAARDHAVTSSPPDTTEKDSLAETPQGSEQYAMYLTNLGLTYQSKYSRFARPSDIDTAIECVALAVRGTSEGATERPIRVSYLANAYFLRGARVGSLDDLQTAIDLGEEALAATGSEHPSRGLLLTNLGAAYQERHELTNDSGDLRRARDLAEQALAECRADDPALAGRLWNLGTAHALLFLKTRALDDLISAIDYSERSIAVLPPGHADEAPRLGNLCGYHRVKYEESPDQSLADLDKAVEYGSRGLALLPENDVRRAAIFADLGSVYALRFAEAGELSDFTEAEDLFENALAILPPDDPHRAAILADLAEAYASRSKRGQGVAAPQARARLAAGLTRMDTAPPWARVRLARAVGNVFLHAGETATAAGMFRTAVEALGTVASPDLERQDRIHGVRGEQGLVSQAIAAYLDLNDAAAALDVAEQGRGIAFSGRPDVERDSSGLPGEADTGVVVMLNFGASRSDAVILRGAETTVVRLTGVWWAEARRMIDKLGYSTAHSGAERRTRIAEVLNWLWNRVTEPVFEALDYNGQASTPPRLWWVPVGIASLMPLHAARSSDGACALDYAVSSYAPTIRTLMASRHRPAVRDRRQLTVAMAATPHWPDLRRVAEEARNPIVSPEGSTVLRDGRASVRDVLAEIPKVTWVHFACHAANDHRNPLQSGLVLSDGLLSVAQISARTQDEAELAYLSACESAQAGARHLDEVIHLGTAFQAAGFRHIVGTLWPVGDAAAAQVAHDFYQHLADGGDGTADRAPYALHAAVRRLRSNKPDRPDLWAPFTHLGP